MDASAGRGVLCGCEGADDAAEDRIVTAEALVRLRDPALGFISPEELRVPEYIREEVVRKKGIPFEEVDQMEPYMNQLDFLYMTRVQRERFFNEEDYIRLKDRFILDKEKMSYARPDTYILHPLPRVNEISIEVDDDPRAQYFQQAKNGMYVRMALILKLLGIY